MVYSRSALHFFLFISQLTDDSAIYDYCDGWLSLPKLEGTSCTQWATVYSQYLHYPWMNLVPILYACYIQNKYNLWKSHKFITKLWQTPVQASAQLDLSLAQLSPSLFIILISNQCLKRAFYPPTPIIADLFFMEKTADLTMSSGILFALNSGDQVIGSFISKHESRLILFVLVP